MDEKVKVATESALATAMVSITDTVQQQLASRVAAWGQEAVAACAEISTKMTILQGSIIENFKGSSDAESPCISSRPGDFKAEVTALKSEFVTRLNEMQQLILESNASTSQRLDVLEQHKVRPSDSVANLCVKSKSKIPLGLMAPTVSGHHNCHPR